MADLRSLTAAMFAPHIGSTFRAGEIALRLAEVRPFGIRAGGPRPEPFSVTFTGPPGLEQQILDLDHPALGRLELFVVPIGPDPDGESRYEAVFN